ncbi:DinB family protein [Chryseolinea sp. H1M3-3]|uniref:DinB family protein n=1 Tax=Chryseolinea sp. H1M3-3 TaxID=3034144 RepID=UPI0023EBE8D4|nr:DinB family protein [Chryseolinea sp. H1M3-3]
MKKYFLKLYQYNAWSNKRVLNCLKRQNVVDEKILTLMGHIVAAQFLWLHRIKGLPPPDVKLWGNYSLDQLLVMAEDAGTRWLEFVESTDNFDRELTYTNYVKDLYTNNVETIMIHLVNHSSYHRAQIAMLLRQKGYEPINTDFITYDRVIRGQLKE